MLAELIKKQIAHKLSKGQDISSDLDRASFLYFRGLLSAQEMEGIMALVPQEEVVEEEPVQKVEEEVVVEGQPAEEPVVVEEVQGEVIEEVVEEEQPEVIIVQPEVEEEQVKEEEVIE